MWPDDFVSCPKLLTAAPRAQLRILSVRTNRANRIASSFLIEQCEDFAAGFYCDSVLRFKVLTDTAKITAFIVLTTVHISAHSPITIHFPSKRENNGKHFGGFARKEFS
jgi:hypothetical protein